MLPLRLMGAVHLLVLKGQASALAKFYPSTGGTVVFDEGWREFRRTVREKVRILEGSSSTRFKPTKWADAEASWVALG